MADELPDWHVVSDQIDKDTTLGPGNTGLQTVYHIPVMIDSGPARGSVQEVDVAAADFTPARAKEIIESHINNLHGIATLAKGNARLA